MHANRFPDECFVSVLTPAGRSAVATISVVGSRAVMRVSKLFRPASGAPLQQFPDSRIVFGRWAIGGRDVEELVVCCRGPDTVDVHCHGGRTAARRIVDSLVAAGCREIEWQHKQILIKNCRDISFKGIIIKFQRRDYQSSLFSV